MASRNVAAAWFWVTSVSFSCCGRFLARGTSPWIAATGAVGAPPTGSTGSRPPARTSPAVTTAASAAPADPRDRQPPAPRPPGRPRAASTASTARAAIAPVSATRKVSSGAPPIATQRASGATDWLMASLPQGKAKGHRSRRASAATHQAATAAGQQGSSSSSRWPRHKMAKMTASDRASAAHAYQATLTSQDSSGTNRATPNARPQPNDPRRLRPVSATASIPGPAAASGHAFTGGNEANNARPPPALSSSAQRVPNPPNAPARPVLVPEASAAWEITIGSLTGRSGCVTRVVRSWNYRRIGQAASFCLKVAIRCAIVPNAERLSGGACTSLGVAHMTCTNGLSHD